MCCHSQRYHVGHCMDLPFILHFRCENNTFIVVQLMNDKNLHILIDFIVESTLRIKQLRIAGFCQCISRITTNNLEDIKIKTKEKYV